MFARATLILITLFWVMMNVLLWRSEFGPRAAVGSAVPVEAVWQKVLTAPDNSSLEIHHHGRKIGFGRWVPSVGETAAAQLASEEVQGMVEELTGYRIDFECNVAVGDAASRLRIDLGLRLATNQVWQELTLRLNLRPDAWEIRAVAAEQTVRLKMDEQSVHSERVFKFSDLQNPQALLREFGGPFPLALLAGAGWPTAPTEGASLALGLKWEAHADWFTIGHSPVRVYRLQTRLLDRYQIVVIISRVGEILRVELPDEVVLINDQLTSL